MAEQMTAAERVIKLADLPKMTMKHDDQDWGIKFWFDEPNPKQPDEFETCMLEWPDGLKLWLDRRGTDTMHSMLDKVGPARLFNMLYLMKNQATSVYLVQE